MPDPIALCLESLDTAEGDCRYVQCVAVAGLGPGLRVDRDGLPLWKSEQDVAFVLCVSADDRLILLRPESGDNVAIIVHRAGRSVAAGVGKPIVLVDKDRIQVGERTLRVHVHGPAPEVHEPRALAPRPARWKFRTAAATLALGAAIGAASGNAAGQSAAPVRGQDAGNTGGAGGGMDAGTETDASEDGPDAPIEVREALLRSNPDRVRSIRVLRLGAAPGLRGEADEPAGNASWPCGAHPGARATPGGEYCTPAAAVWIRSPCWDSSRSWLDWRRDCVRDPLGHMVLVSLPMSNAYPPQGQPPAQYPMPVQQPPAGSPPATPQKWWGGYVSLAMLALSLLLGIGTGIAAFSSESLGVMMSYVAIGPFAFGIAGLIVAVVTKKNANPKVAIGAPIGCGCLAWIVAVMMLVVFMVAIFPSL